jgi:hypothetical protein
MKYSNTIKFYKKEYKSLYKNQNTSMKIVLNDIKSGKYILSDIERYSINVILTFHYSEDFKKKVMKNENYESTIRKAIYLQTAIGAAKRIEKEEKL